MRRLTLAIVVLGVVTLAACSGGPQKKALVEPTTTVAALSTGVPSTTTSAPTTTTVPLPAPAQPRISADPATMADALVGDERALRDPSSSEATLVAAARRQQVAYRAIGRHPEWDPIVQPRIPADLRYAYDRNVDARRQFTAMAGPDPAENLPVWRIDPPLPPDELLGYYRKAEQVTGVGWSYLAAIHLVETGLGRIAGLSYAGAQGPMQFMPATFAAYGEGDINSAHDSIISAGRYLAANGFVDGDVDGALWHYNHSDNYVQAVKDYAEVLVADAAAYNGYYRWDIYYFTASGDVMLPVGYLAYEPIPVTDYLAKHPQ
jgi:hypothetical protein